MFFPSFEFLEKTVPYLDLPGFRILHQPRRASTEALKEILVALNEERGLVVLAVQGGSLSEGIDLPGEALIGCVVVGPPIPPFDLERKLTKEYFERTYGEGEAFTYTYPAMAKAIQAAGRVIRGPEERGLIALLDGRFLEPSFAECFPQDWFKQSAQEAVSDGILAKVARFWEQ
ncbi:MAG: helicase C-terminal domain-containing protein [Holophaga sp.]|nr:helicase C-terminal domain-containing protein [Holophaga sp.]